MSSGIYLKEFINKRLTAAAAEIFSEFEQTIVRYEEEIARQRRLLEISWKPQISLHRIKLPQLYVRKDEEVLTDQQLWNQERTSSLDQKEPEPLHEETEPPQEQPEHLQEETELLQEQPEPPQMKVEQDDPEPLQILEQEELSISQDEQPFVLKQEMLTSLVTPADEERDHDEPESNSDQLLSSVFPEAEIRAAAPAASTACPDFLQHHVWDKEEVLTDQQLSNQETTSSLDQKEPEPPLITEEQQQLCVRQPEGQFILRQENVTFMVTSPSEEVNCREPDRNQPLCQSSTEAKNQDQGGCRNENSDSNSNEDLSQTKICRQTKDHRDDVDSQNPKRLRRADRDETPFTCKTCGKCFCQHNHLTTHMKSHTGERPFTCTTCGKCFTLKGSLTKHMCTYIVENSYLCKTCGNSFFRNGDLTKHMRIHIGEKPLPCKTCGIYFYGIDHLTSHLRTQHGLEGFSLSDMI